jgi:DNA polymerase type B, organellar and viral
VEPDAYGFFYCNITSPALLKHPILQRKIKGRGTVAGLGSWTGWISSVEMNNAIKLGYTFEILKGYQFETGDLFSGYVNKMYELRLQFEKGHPMNLIAKLLMNSLYGKFGMKMERTVVDIFNLNVDADKLALRKLLDTVAESIQDHVELGDNKYLFVRSALSNVFNDDNYHGSDVNIAIASAITAAARVQMSVFKNNPNFNLYYSDTDSIVIDNSYPNLWLVKN